MFTVVAWSESQDSAVLVPVAALADQHIRVEGDNVIVPSIKDVELNALLAAMALGPNVTRAQLVSPSLRRFLNLEIFPISVAAEPAVPTAFVDLFDNPIILDPAEPLSAQAAEDAVGASRATILAWLGDGQIETINGEVRTVLATNTTTLVANAWTNGALTFDQSLPAGQYAIVGARAFSAGLQAFRFALPGYGHRPGAIGYDAAGDVGLARFNAGGLGVWGYFNHNTPPTVDFLSNSADTSQSVYLDLVKVA